MIKYGYEKSGLDKSFLNYTKEEINKIINQINFIHLCITPIILTLLLICYVLVILLLKN